MSPSFAQQRIPSFDFLNLLGKIKTWIFGHRKKEISTEGYVERVDGEYFTTRKGFSLICDAYASEFQALGGELKLESKLGLSISVVERL